MGAQGTAELDFGAFPGGSDASVAVTGQASILGTSLVEAWLIPQDTTDHLADEHLLESIRVMAGNIVAGTGFTIYGVNTSQVNEPLEPIKGAKNVTVAGTLNTQNYSQQQFAGGMGTRIYGKWTVGWVWN